MYEAAKVSSVETLTDRRAGTRHVAVMLVAKLNCDHSNSICRIRNISAMGVRLTTHFELVPGQQISLELRSDLRMTGEVMWSRDGNAGVQFASPIDVPRFLARPESRIDRIKVRAPRYDCKVEAVVTTDSGSLTCRIADIGMSGAGIVDLPLSSAFRQGKVLKLETEGISAHNATVAWVTGQRAGLKFRHPLSYTDLQQWLNDSTRLRHAESLCRDEQSSANFFP